MYIKNLHLVVDLVFIAILSKFKDVSVGLIIK